MRSKEKVWNVFKGCVSQSIPFLVESDDKRYEYLLGDIVTSRAKIIRWDSFYRTGGPFQRKDRLRSWIDNIDPDNYDWETDFQKIHAAIKNFIRIIKPYASQRFIIFKVLGPTESAEAFFVNPGSISALGIRHHFNFALFSRICPKKAVKIYDKIASIIYELIKAGCEIDYVNGVRVADDVATYKGPIYPSIIISRFKIWHIKYASIIRKSGKTSIIHSDGNISHPDILNVLLHYNGVHPLDLNSRNSISDFNLWIKNIVDIRKILKSNIFLTGIPIEMVFNDKYSVHNLKSVVLNLIKEHGSENLILSTTHSPYPGRGYYEPDPWNKIIGLKLKML